MKQIVILGAGTAGTIVANRLRDKLPADWALAVVDPEPQHLYQPDLLFLAFDKIAEDKIHKPRSRTLPGVTWIRNAVKHVNTEARQVALAGGEILTYDLLVVATGSQIRPDETEGLLGDRWNPHAGLIGPTAHDFYTLDGARSTRDALARFTGGRLVVNVVEMPIKCPVAPLEFLFLADEYLTLHGRREQTEIVYATPLDGAFTKPIASAALSGLLERKGIQVESEYNTGEVDVEAGMLRSWDEREIPFDLLISIPAHGGAPFLASSGLGNEMDFVRTERHTLAAKGHDKIFVLGDATDLPSSKAGSVAHFQAEVVAENVLREIAGKSPIDGFDGHSNCFIETGFGKGLMIDFNYDVEPLPGTYPIPGLGPFTLLRESRRNHWGKEMFRWVYWHGLLPARPLPFVETQLSMAGKWMPAA